MSSRDQLRLSVGATQNRNLFPVHFLEDRLPEWPEYADLDTSELFRVIAEIWERERELLPEFNEEQTEDRLIRPILGALGFQYTARPDLSVAGRRRSASTVRSIDDGPQGASPRTPVAQIIHYISITRVPFGILTNAKVCLLVLGFSLDGLEFPKLE